jgi:hypothetical protein
MFLKWGGIGARIFRQRRRLLRLNRGPCRKYHQGQWTGRGVQLVLWRVRLKWEGKYWNKKHQQGCQKEEKK